MVKKKERYDLLLRFFHPSLDPRVISDLLKLKPRRSWKAGDQAEGVNGELLKFKHKDSYWSYSISRDDRIFSEEINKTLEMLSPHKKFLSRFTKQGGRINLYLQLPGDTNVGSRLNSDIIAKMANLRVEFDIEVFPNFPVRKKQNRRK